MAVKRERAGSAIDVVDRVLDRGIVIDAVVCLGFLGIDHIVDIEVRVVVTSIETYLQYAKPLASVNSAGRSVRKQASPARGIALRTQDCSRVGFSVGDSIRARGLGVRLDRRGREERPVQY